METEQRDNIPEDLVEDDNVPEDLLKDENKSLELTDVLQTTEETVVSEETLPVSYPIYQCEYPWVPVCGSVAEMGRDQRFFKGCKWSPDGTCLLTCTDDSTLKLFDLPADLYKSHNLPFQGCSLTEINPALKIKEGELIYDYCWHPHMSSWHPETCLLASTAKNSPVHLWDAYRGKLVATYRAYNSVDEVEAASSISISPDGEKLYCGFDKCIRVFDIKIPGRECDLRPTKFKDGCTPSQSGIVSCIAVNPALPTVYAAASYMKTIGLYSEPDGTPLCVLEGHRGGVTHLKFSPDGFFLYSGGRKDPEIICWDLRNPGQVLYTVNRTVQTNQRIYFDLDPTGRFLITGDTNGFIRVWDTQKALEVTTESASTVPAELCSWKPHDDCTNGVSCHPWLPLVATSSGQRHTTLASYDSEASDSECEGGAPPLPPPSRENNVKLWWAGSTPPLAITTDDFFSETQQTANDENSI
uniref:WD repeat-containing protein 79 n=1 Tax=Evadne anonyx TaxID=141404 RepID=A0A9N6WTJ2_9CRUS|nr:EOG090X06W9 [Evadne anonyx]